MQRRHFLGTVLALCPGFWPARLGAVDFAPVLPGRRLQFPDDHGAHPAFRTEWWYATGWLERGDGRPLGFQITFFRVRTGIGEASPSRFAPGQIMFAHAALADPEHGRLRHAERAARVGFGRAGFATGTTRVAIGDWEFRLDGGQYIAHVRGEDFGYALTLAPGGPPMLNGQEGFSAKAADPSHASYYYSRPQLQVTGQIMLDGRQEQVGGRAWLDHEWSSELLPEDAQGWDWIGINLHDGGALMAFRMRDRNCNALWSAATLQMPGRGTRSFGPDAVAFAPGRRWRSPRTGIDYPIAWQVQVGERHFRLEPLMDDQELDSRRSTGAIYWEGAVRVSENRQMVGEGYLEMTGYAERLRVG